MTLVELWNVLFVKQRRFFLLVLFVALAAAGAASFLLPRRYDATATLFIGESRPASTGGQSVPLDDVRAQTYRELLSTPAIRQEAAREIARRGHAFAGDINFDISAGTHLIGITATDSDPNRAADVATAYAETFVRSRRRRVSERVDARLRRLEQRVRTLTRQRKALGRSPRDLETAAAIDNRLAAARDAYKGLVYTNTVEGEDVSLASAAVPPSAPARPRPKLYMAIGAIFGLLLATAAALLRNVFDRRVRDEEEIGSILGTQVLTRVPDTATRDSDNARLVRESYHFLRANLDFLAESGPESRTIAVTAAVPNAGKTTVVAELARTLAAGGLSVVAVDGDLRKPNLDSALSVAAGAGLSQALAQSRPPADLLVTNGSGVQVLAAGPIPPNPSLLLTSERLSALVGELREDADYVLIDTPPLLTGPEASRISALADGVLMVVDIQNSHRPALIAARDQLRKAHARVLGTVLTRVPLDSHFYGYYGYGARPEEGNGTTGRARARSRS